MSDSKPLDRDLKKLKYDNRMQDFNVRNGYLKKEELETYIKGLDDVASNAVQIDLEEGYANGAAH